MKPILTIFLITLFISPAALAQTASELTVIDTKNTDEPPSAYSQLVRFDFKGRSIIQSPGAGLFGSTMTIAQWANNGTGNRNHQLHFNDGGMFYRNGGSNSSSWDSWKSIVLADVNGNVGLGISVPKWALDIAKSDNTASIHLSRTGSFGASWFIHSGRLGSGEFSIGDDSEYRMVIKNNGSIGIGTIEPFSKISFGQPPSFNNQVSRIAIAETSEGKYFYGIGGYVETSNDPMTAGLGIWGGTENQTPWDGSNGVKPHIFIKRSNGNVLIGKTTQTNTTYKLDVAGKIRADEIVVNTTGADFVFEPTYKLRSLSELETFIKKNRHLPGIAPAAQMQTEGVSLSEMQTILLQKQEETLLYLIEQAKQMDALKKENDLLKEDKNELMKMILEIKGELDKMSRHNNK